MQKPRELLFLLRGRGLAWTYEDIIHSKAHVGTVTGGADTKEREGKLGEGQDKPESPTGP